MMPLLSVRGLKVSIRTDEGTAQVLDDVGLELERGRILGVVGESGCGKSTLIRAIMGILPKGARVEQGEIWFEGENLLVFSEKRTEPRRALQPHRLHPAGPAACSQSGVQGRRAAPGGHALARAG